MKVSWWRLNKFGQNYVNVHMDVVELEKSFNNQKVQKTNFHSVCFGCF